jgi:glucose-6-phosphate-specific signal transduction histidine kinase
MAFQPGWQGAVWLVVLSSVALVVVQDSHL